MVIKMFSADEMELLSIIRNAKRPEELVEEAFRLILEHLPQHEAESGLIYDCQRPVA